MEVNLTGKSAIITGAASGIGLATVLRFLDSDVLGVVAVDRAEKLPEPLASRAAAEPARLRYVRGSVTDEATAVEFTRVAQQSFGRIDILINNAGVSVVKPLHEHTPAEWDFVMDTNVKAIYLAVRHVVPVMMAQRSGVVLITGSISGQVGIPGQGAYGPSKGAVHEMTRQLAVEYAAHGIRVNAVGCGTIDTPLVHHSAELSGKPDEFWAMLRGNHPIGRIASADEVAAFYTYLSSDLASFFTGAILMLDGGFTAK